MVLEGGWEVEFRSSLESSPRFPAFPVWALVPDFLVTGLLGTIVVWVVLTD